MERCKNVPCVLARWQEHFFVKKKTFDVCMTPFTTEQQREIKSAQINSNISPVLPKKHKNIVCQNNCGFQFT